ncbi:glyoxalase [Bryobacterales bacterium F-183]|nr:glyoxalase [Bryobacterales bacterium F-183]
MRTALLLPLLGLLFACQRPPKAMVHPVGYFEIPVHDLDRAQRFYEGVFEVTLERRKVDGYDMALFPFAAGSAGATGALVKGDIYIPAKAGPVLYFGCQDVVRTLGRAVQAGGKVLYQPKTVEPGIMVAEFEDSEGNRIALQSRP